MKIGNLEFNPIVDNQNLVPKCIYDLVNNWDNLEEKNKFLVAEINPDFADGNMNSNNNESDMSDEVFANFGDSIEISDDDIAF